MSLADGKDVATILGVIAALFVYVQNSIFQRRTHRFERLSRFMEVYRDLFRIDGYIMLNVAKMVHGNFERLRDDLEMEKKFHEMLLNVERLAILDNSKAAPRELQVYMFGWYAKHIIATLSPTEHHDLFWELAIDYLQALVNDAKEYEGKPLRERKLTWAVK